MSEERSPPCLWWLIKWLPYSVRLDVLEAAAWPAYEVRRKVFIYDPTNPSGVSATTVPLRHFREETGR